MKSSSDNFRSSAIIDIIDSLASFAEELIIYEPLLDEIQYKGFRVIKDIEEFKDISDLIVSNRKDKKLEDVDDKLFCRDIFGID